MMWECPILIITGLLLSNAFHVGGFSVATLTRISSPVTELALPSRRGSNPWTHLVPPLLKQLDTKIEWDTQLETAEQLVDRWCQEQPQLVATKTTCLHQRRKELQQALESFHDVCEQHLNYCPTKFRARIVATRGSAGTKCPQFHTDHVPLRYIQALLGPGCQYVQSSKGIDWSRINALDDDDEEVCGIEERNAKLVDPKRARVMQAPEGAAMVLAGNRWKEFATTPLPPAVHKSPSELLPWQGRVLLTLDVVLDEYPQAATSLQQDVSFWKTKTIENPTDSNAFYQLSQALLDQEGGQEGSVEEQNARQALVALEEAVRLERTRITEGTDPSNLIAALRSLSMACLRLGQKEARLVDIDEIAQLKALKMPFEQEQDLSPTVVPIEPIVANDDSSPDRIVAYRTLEEPILESEQVRSIRDAAQAYRDIHGASGSRFTMQYRGNSDVHLSDLVSQDPGLLDMVNAFLQKRVYPLARSAYDIPVTSPLCVYDSLIVHYDADEAKESGRVGASLPLHRDGGQISVNIALNSDDQFQGGGTFFDSLIGTDEPVQRPIGVGHAIVHRSTERHAGAPTEMGTREILVVFLTTRQTGPASATERSFYLKEMAQLQSPKLKLQAYQLAAEQNPDDGEAKFWAGFLLVQLGRFDEGIEYLEQASRLNPNDARTQNYLGLAYCKRWNGAHRADLLEDEEMTKATVALERALWAADACGRIGCNDDMSMGTALLTLGELYAHQEKWAKAESFLSKVSENIDGYPDDIRQAMLRDAMSLLSECRRQQQEQQGYGSTVG